MITCPKCHGLKRLDDRGFPWQGQPAFEIIDCDRCDGTGEVNKRTSEEMVQLNLFKWYNQNQEMVTDVLES
jgi:DnaJ-class molecular chaperone